MTWYWWTHWFWITFIFVIGITGYPIQSSYDNKESNQNKPLKFPLAAQTDTDGDSFRSDDISLSSILRDKKSFHNKNIGSENITKPSENILVNVSKVENVPVIIDSSIEVNVTKIPPINSVAENVTVSIISNNISYVTTSPSNDGLETTLIEIIDTTENNGNNTFIISTEESTTKFFESNNNSSYYNSTNNSTTPTIEVHLQNSNESKGEQNMGTELFGNGFNLDNITEEEEIIRAQIEKQLSGERARKSKVLSVYRQELKLINFSSDAKNLLARSALQDLEEQDGNISSEALAIERAYILNAGAISGICLAVLGFFCGFAMIGVVLYRRRYINKPQTLSEPDSSVYIDDSTIRDNSDEMYSLDNDSFLNSLEAMTIQNYWTDTVKHTKL